MNVPTKNSSKKGKYKSQLTIAYDAHAKSNCIQVSLLVTALHYNLSIHLANNVILKFDFTIGDLYKYL